MLPDREPVPNSDSTAYHLKIITQETGDGGKGMVALFRKLATWEGGRRMSQRPYSPSREVMGKGREGVLCAREAGAQVVSRLST